MTEKSPRSGLWDSGVSGNLQVSRIRDCTFTTICLSVLSPQLSEHVVVTMLWAGGSAFARPPAPRVYRVFVRLIRDMYFYFLMSHFSHTLYCSCVLLLLSRCTNLIWKKKLEVKLLLIAWLRSCVKRLLVSVLKKRIPRDIWSSRVTRSHHIRLEKGVQKHTHGKIWSSVSPFQQVWFRTFWYIFSGVYWKVKWRGRQAFLLLCNGSGMPNHVYYWH